MTEEAQIRRGICQSCVLLPTLFNFYSEEIFSEALSELDSGIRINGKYLNNIRYADDTVLFATNLPDLQQMLYMVRDTSARLHDTA